jgi:hypothetical protein
MNDPQYPEFESLTERDKACLHLKVPLSNNPDLNELITECRRMDFLQAFFCAANEKAKTKDGADPQADESQIYNLRQKAREYTYTLHPILHPEKR